MSLKKFKLYEKLDSSVTDGTVLFNVLCTGEDERQEGHSAEIMLPDEVKELVISSAKSCSYCQASFVDAQEQRAHYKLDWHRYNLKQALFGRPTVGEDNFQGLADDVSSISGSESESSDDEEKESSEQVRQEEDRLLAFRDAKVFWQNKAGNAFSIYKCLLLGRRELVSALALQESLTTFLKAPKKWLIVMLGGGHFAAAVFNGSDITVHKTFHCYTVRAKQGGSQASRDARGGNHPKSAGASLRRYNEMALVQHVQDIMKAWVEEISNCSLILHRAVGPHNRSVLFGGKTPPFAKADPRLRSVPFATRRATLKEVKRIHDVLSTLQSYGSAADLQKELSPSDRKPNTHNSPHRKPLSEQINEHFGEVKKKPARKVDRAKERVPRERELPGVRNRSSSSDSEDYSHEFVTNDVEIDLNGLKEFDDSVRHKKKKKPSGKQRVKMEKEKLGEEMEELQRKLLRFCQQVDVTRLQGMIKEAEVWPSRDNQPNQTPPPDLAGIEAPQPSKTILKKEDFIECLTGVVLEESGDTLLHVAASKCSPALVTVLLETGCDPTVRNRKKLVPFVVSGDKATKTAFKDFVVQNPDKFDSSQTMIPLPLSEEQEKIMNEKKKEKRKQQKEREKVKKKENFARKTDEDERVRFLALSDREKRAVAAEKRLVQQVTANSSKAVAPALVRCFQCGTNITGKVPFEYSTHLFCSVKCLQAHRSKTKSYGVEI